MIRNYLRTALRLFRNNKTFSVINISGLALGMTCSLLIFLWVQDEYAVDAFHNNNKRLYYVYERYTMQGKPEGWYWTQGPLAAALKKEIPEIVRATPFSWSRINTFRAGEKIIKEDGYAADEDFFTMFSYPLLEGSAMDALKTPNSLAISRKMAVALFGSPAAAIGKTVRYEDKKDFAVSAVFEDLHGNVSSSFNYIMSWKAYLEDDNDWARYWGSTDPRTVVLLRQDADPAAVEKKIVHLIDQFHPEEKSLKVELALQRFDEYYLHSDMKNGRPAGGRIGYVRLFSLVALFILLIACINFMNLTTARSIRRSKEIGVRKVIGARRGMLIRQFILEAILMAMISAILALLLTSLALPAFNQLTEKYIHLPYDSPAFWLRLSGLTVLTGFLSGIYPAFFLSSFQPLRILKGVLLPAGGNAAGFRKGLVVFQFTLSIVLILSTLLISRQVSFLQKADTGYDRENLVYIPIEGRLASQLGVFTTMASRIPGISGVTMLSDNPTQMENGTLSVEWPGKNPSEHARFISDRIGPNYIQTMKIHLLAGRDFSPAYPTDSMGCILNETALNLMGYKVQDAVGKTVYWGGRTLHIVGVAADFHIRSLHDPIQPLILSPGRNEFSTILIRVQAGRTRSVLADVQGLCHQLNPAFPFSYKFSDQEYADLYKSDEITGRLSLLFAGLAIFISCLGLLGLSIFMAEQRIKEIGIRKVLGASMHSLLKLLVKDLLGLVAISFVIAAPLGWWVMHHWLENFAYRTNIPWWIFAAAGSLALFTALSTIIIQAVQAATRNPVKSLRTE
ncbi:MAG: ABC transporter permease [Chitinophagaceae bacterium]|nr:ABC transporter permease [Chitinophagaceae bacterium]